jgi:hypothetical protein
MANILLLDVDTQHQKDQPISSNAGQGEAFAAIVERRLSRRRYRRVIRRLEQPLSKKRIAYAIRFSRIPTSF